MPQQKPKNDYERLSREIEQDVRQAVEAVGAALRGAASGAQSAFGESGAAGAFGGAARRAGQALGGAAGAAAQPASRTSMARISIRRRRWSTSFQKKSVFYIIIQNTPERKPPGVWMRKKLSR